MLLTPRASENEQRTTKRTPAQEAGTHGKYLAAEVVRLLPTPVAHDDGKTPEAHLAMKAGMDGGPRSQITSLTVLAKAGFRQPVKLLPTPVEGDSRNSRNKIGRVHV